MRTRTEEVNHYDRERYLAKLREIRDRYYAGEPLTEEEMRCLLPFLRAKVLTLTEALRISSVRRTLRRLIEASEKERRGKYSTPALF